jgi:cobalt-zinc-cadmium efflux system outer membrane protein
MTCRTLRRAWLALGLCLIVGCSYGAQGVIDANVCDLSRRPWDLQPRVPIDHTPPTLPPPHPVPNLIPVSYLEPVRDSEPVALKEAGRTLPDFLPELHEVAQEAKPEEEKGLPERLKIPSAIPGSQAPPINLPPFEKGAAAEAKRAAAIDRLYPPLPPLGEDPSPQTGPHGQPLTLADLQMLGMSNSPLIYQATAAVESARGAAIQAGLPPNPIIGYEADTMGTVGGPGYQGGYIEQWIKTGNKLQLARAVATMELRRAELAMRRAEFDLATSVRRGYFSVLVAEQAVRVTRGLAEFTSETYRAQVDLVKHGLSAAYEPMQLRVLAVAARGQLVQARNQLNAAWKQLATAMGLPGMPRTALAGSVDLPLPRFSYDEVLARVLTTHTDIQSAEVLQQKARYSLALARITPVPDVFLRVMAQKDRTGPPFAITPSVIVGMPIPVWDRNQGGTIQAEADLVQADEESHAARCRLTSELATAFQNYDSNRELLGYYRDQILPDQVRAYRGVIGRFLREPAGAPNPATFADIVNAQQILASVIATYLQTLSALWSSVVEVADLLQTDDLFQVQTDPHAIPSVPSLESLPPLPCCHPCSPVDPALRNGADGSWPGKTPCLFPPPGPAKEEKPPEKPQAR